MERVIAERMAYGAIKYGVIHPNLARALPKRSATDIVTALVYDVEKALGSGKVVTLVTEDVMGGFDATLPNRTTLRLRQQGWPDFLVRWIPSYLRDRMARVRLVGTTTESTKLPCGLPQGVVSERQMESPALIQHLQLPNRS